jgi:hypothetical protein
MPKYLENEVPAKNESPRFSFENFVARFGVSRSFFSPNRINAPQILVAEIKKHLPFDMESASQARRVADVFCLLLWVYFT